MSVHSMWCTLAGPQDAPVKPQGQGSYTAEVCCRQAGLVTVLGKLNDRAIGRPETLQIKASTACKLQVTNNPICCTAGLTPCPKSVVAYHMLQTTAAPLHCPYTRELCCALAAGIRAKVVFCCLDAFGNQLEEGGAQLEGHFTIERASAPFHAMPHPCEAADDGNGLYTLSFIPETVGAVEVSRLVLHSCSKSRVNRLMLCLHRWHGAATILLSIAAEKGSWQRAAPLLTPCCPTQPHLFPL